MESIHNFRDVGGYKTQSGMFIKKGLLYRCGSLATASDNDLRELSSLGIKTVCDLRTHKEKMNHPDRFPVNSSVKSLHIPIKAKMHNESKFIFQLFSVLFGKARKIDFHEAFKQVYREYVTDFRTEFSAIIKLVVDSSNLPLLIHCTGGKDRTGFACSLIHLILGVPVEMAMQDYLLTNDYSHQFKAQMIKRLKRFAFLGVSIQKFYPLLEARREYLNAALHKISMDYGSIEDYFYKGLDFSETERLRHLLLENPIVE